MIFEGSGTSRGSFLEPQTLPKTAQTTRPTFRAEKWPPNRFPSALGEPPGPKKKSWNFQGRHGKISERDFIENETWLSWNGKRVRSESRKQGERNKSAKIAANTASGDGEEAPTRTRTTTSGTARASRQRARTRDCSLASALRAAASALRAGSVPPGAFPPCIG